jgi:LysM repeat protein
MSLSWRRRLGAIVLVVLILSSIVVPAASAGTPNKNDASWSNTPSAGGMCPVYYRVRKGDNLTIISRRYGVSIWQMQQWNNIWNPDRIYLGQTLVIYKPCRPPAPPPPPPSHHHPPAPAPCVTCWPANPPAPQPVSGWLGQFFNGRDLSGSPIFEMRTSSINFNWGGGSPAPGVPATNFSARWTIASNAMGGTYRVTVRSDDGVRVFIDGMQVLSNWQVQPATICQVDVVLTPGWHNWTVEYFQAEGLSEISFGTQRLY